MRKLFFLFSVAAVLVLTSFCGDDSSDTSNQEEIILPKTMKITYPDHPAENRILRFIYDGNKIVRITCKNLKLEFTYNGNVIVKATVNSIDNGKDVKKYEAIYTYVNNKLATESFFDGFSDEYPTGKNKKRSVITHNSDGTIKEELYKINAAGIEEKRDAFNIYTYVKGNLIKKVETYGKENHTYVFEYDSKNNPGKNILGFNLFIGLGYLLGLNNTTKSIESNSKTTASLVSTSEYIFDENGYPTKITQLTSEKFIKEINEFTY